MVNQRNFQHLIEKIKREATRPLVASNFERKVVRGDHSRVCDECREISPFTMGAIFWEEPFNEERKQAKFCGACFNAKFPGHGASKFQRKYVWKPELHERACDTCRSILPFKTYKALYYQEPYIEGGSRSKTRKFCEACFLAEFPNVRNIPSDGKVPFAPFCDCCGPYAQDYYNHEDEDEFCEDNQDDEEEGQDDFMQEECDEENEGYSDVEDGEESEGYSDEADDNDSNKDESVEESDDDDMEEAPAATQESSAQPRRSPRLQALRGN